VTPVQKVISLLGDMQAAIEEEGRKEAETYKNFSCFCENKTQALAPRILKGRDDCHRLSSDFEEKSAQVTAKQDELKNLIGKKVNLDNKKKNAEILLAKETGEYEADAADLSKAISSLDGAIKTLESSKPSSAGLMETSQSVKANLALADSMKLIDDGPKWSFLESFIQQKVAIDPTDPEYKFHSHGIVEVLKKLLEDFKKKKADAESEWSVSKKVIQDTISNAGEQLDLNSRTQEAVKNKIDTLVAEAADIRGNLVTATVQLQDDKRYLQELTAICEARAKDWDQRTLMRAGELEVISKALTIMTDKVKSADEKANQRALLQVQGAGNGSQGYRTRKLSIRANVSTRNSSVVLASKAWLPKTNVSKSVRANASKLQDVVTISRRGVFLLQTSLVRSHLRGGLKLNRRLEGALDMLQKEGQRLGSAVLSSLAVHIAGADDPFAKVQKMIQNLIERLLAEATEEATKKGFCDKELRTGMLERDARLSEVRALNTEIGGLKVKEDELNMEMDDLKAASSDLTSALKAATVDRDASKQDNLDTLKIAREGLKAAKEALVLLQDFYRQAALTTNLLQEIASPLEAENPGAGFKGNYKGRQSASTGVIGLLEVIVSDFERTIKTTEESETEAATEFAKFSSTTEADISSKSTKQQLDLEDLALTRSSLEAKQEDMKTNMNLLDEEIKQLELHNKMCVDHGQSYEERKTKREEEITALKSALCLLDTNGVEEDCNTVQLKDG